MPTRSNHFSEAIVIPLFTILVCAMVEESDQTLSNPVSELCLRKCGVALANTSIPKRLSKIRCHHECQKRETDCPDSSPDQLVDWTPNRINIRIGKYENLSSWYVNMSWAPMNDNYGNWTGILVRLVIRSEHESSVRPKCFVCPVNQTFLRINISSYDYRHPDSIFVNISALPYHSVISDLLQVFPPKLSTSRPTATKATSKPTTKTATSKLPTKTGCNNEYGDLVWYPDKVNAKFSRESDKMSYVNISWSPLTDPTVAWKGYMLSFFLGDVPVSGYSLKSSCFKLPKNQTYFIVDSSRGWKNSYSSIAVNVTAYPRPQLEVAELRYFPSPISRSPPASTVKVSPKPTVSYILASQQPTVFGMSASQKPTAAKPDIVKIVFSSVGGCAVLLTVLIAVVLFHRRCKWRFSEETVETRKCFKYHAFIIYSMLDSQWVDTILIPTLQNYGFKCCVHWKDFLPGKVFTENIVESVYSSFKIIAVISSHFMSSNSCYFELQHAMTRLKNNRDDCLIIIKFDNTDIKRLPAEILKRSYIDFTRQTDRSTWESKLAEILNKAVVEDDSSSTITTCTSSNNNRLSEGSSTASELICLCQNV